MARTEFLRVRVSIGELSQIDELAREYGQTRAAYVRDAALGLSHAPAVIAVAPDQITTPEQRRRHWWARLLRK